MYTEGGRVFQGLGHSLKEYGPFDHVIIMTGTNDLGDNHAGRPGVARYLPQSWSSDPDPFTARKQWHQSGGSEMPLVRVTMGVFQHDVGTELLVR